MRGEVEMFEVDELPASHTRRTALQHRVRAVPAAVRRGYEECLDRVFYHALSDRRRHEGNRTDPVV
jgi:hypothetical protein